MLGIDKDDIVSIEAILAPYLRTVETLLRVADSNCRSGEIGDKEVANGEREHSEQNCSQALAINVRTEEILDELEDLTALANTITANLRLLAKIKALPQDIFDCKQVLRSIIHQLSKLFAALVRWVALYLLYANQSPEIGAG
jgi:hypothetical protein